VLDKLTDDELHADNQLVLEPLICAGDERRHGWSFDGIRQSGDGGEGVHLHLTYLQRQNNPHDLARRVRRQTCA
jgi:hypothetical protein